MKKYQNHSNVNSMEYKDLDTRTEIIHGHYDLVLRVGSLYEVHYGIHQGIFQYVGKVKENDKVHPYSRGQHLFKNIDTEEITFGYYGYNSPYEFTTIVHEYKQ